MNLIEILRQTIATFRAHKMRIFLMMFGIVWGISSVILLVGLGKGFSADQKRRMQTLGKDLVSSLARFRSPSEYFPDFDSGFDHHAFNYHVHRRNVPGTTRGGHGPGRFAAV